MSFVTALRRSGGSSAADFLEIDDEDMGMRHSSLAPLNNFVSNTASAAVAGAAGTYGHTNNRNHLLNSLFTSSWSSSSSTLPQQRSTVMTTTTAASGNTHQQHQYQQHSHEENDYYGANGASANSASNSILRRLSTNLGRNNVSDNSYKGGWGTSVFDLDQNLRNDDGGGSRSSSVISQDTTTVTMTSDGGGADDNELSFSRMASTLISSSSSSSASTGSQTTSSSNSPFSSWRFGDRIRKLNETTSFELSSRLPRVMSLVDPQGGKGPLPLTVASVSSSSSTSSLGSGGGSDSLMLGDESEPSDSLSVVTTSLPIDFFNTSYFTNDTDWGNDTAIDPTAGGNYNYFALLLIIFPLVAMFGNVLVILSVKRERSLWNVTNYFIVSLAEAYLLVAAVVMPFAVYFLFNFSSWGLAPIFCDFYIAMDVTCSTSSILNLVAISIDRFIAVTQPIKYAQYKSNTRVWLTIVFVWVSSGLVGSPIVLGLNNPPDNGMPRDLTECSFHNKYFVLFSSLCSFYIPCTILVYLYYRIFKVIHERAKKAAGGGRGVSGGGATVIENLPQTRKLAETNLSGPSNLASASKKASLIGGGGGNAGNDNGGGTLDDEKCTNTGSGSQDDGDEKDLDMVMEGDGEDEDSPNSDDCQIITNTRLASAFVLESVRPEDRGLTCRMEPNGNHDSGYAASNLEEGAHPVMVQEPSPASPKYSLSPHDQCKRNGLSKSKKDIGESSAAQSPGDASSGSAKKPASRFTLGKVHKASRKKREKSSAKRERKATKTLAIVLGLFLACWLPFFTCNIMDALCSMLDKGECSPGMTTFLLTTWLGYVNSCLNPVIYTVFNPEFRKAFKKILGMGP